MKDEGYDGFIGEGTGIGLEAWDLQPPITQNPCHMMGVYFMHCLITCCIYFYIFI